MKIFAKHKIKCVTAVAMALCMATSAFAATPKTDSIVTSDQITVGDVFSDVTTNAGRYLAPAPEMGKTVVFGTYDLQRISDAFNLGWKPDANGTHVTIRRAGNEIDAADVQASLEKKFSQEMGGRKFELELSDRKIGFHVPAAADRTVLVDKLNYDAVNNTFKATVAAAGAPDLRKEVSGRYYAVSQVPVLKAPLRPGDVISKNDIDYVDMRGNDISPSMVTDAANLVGQTPRRGVAAMKPLMLSDVKLPLVVKKGDMVMMTLKNNLISLTTQGRALENGAAGDAIRVMNSTSKQVVDAIVTGAQAVSVTAPL